MTLALVGAGNSKGVQINLNRAKVKTYKLIYIL
jgi:hypothetical protein